MYNKVVIEPKALTEDFEQETKRLFKPFVNYFVEKAQFSDFNIDFDVTRQRTVFSTFLFVRIKVITNNVCKL
jgi:hypothetical protein